MRGSRAAKPRTAGSMLSGAASVATTCVRAQVRLPANWRCAEYMAAVGCPSAMLAFGAMLWPHDPVELEAYTYAKA